MSSKKAMFGCRGVVLLIVLCLFLPSVLAVSVKMVSNTPYCFNCETIYEICKEAGDKDTTLDFNFYRPDETKDSTFKGVLLLEKETEYTEQKPIYDIRKIEVETYDNKTGEKSTAIIDDNYIKSYETTTNTKTEFIQTSTAALSSSLNGAAVDNCYKISIRGNLKPGESVDNVLKIGDREYKEWAWWNSSYPYKFSIDCNNITIGVPFVINGTDGFLLPDSATRQIVWAKCQRNMSLYYVNATEYAVSNETAGLPFEVEQGDETSFNPSAVWVGYLFVSHMNKYDATTIKDSSPEQNHLLQGKTCCGGARETDDTTLGMGVGLRQFIYSTTNAGSVNSFLRTTNKLTHGKNASITIQGMATLTKIGANQHAFLSIEDAAVTSLRQWYSHSSYANFVNAVAPTYDDATGTAKDNNGRLVYGVYNGTGFNVYINSTTAIIKTDNFNLAATINMSQYLCVGATCNNYGWNWNGTADEIRVFNGSISESQMTQELFNLKGIIGYGMLTNFDCLPSWSCSDFGVCLSNNTKLCLNVSDAHNCGVEFSGNLSDYTGSCIYVDTNPPDFDLLNWDITEYNHLWILGFLIFLWVALAWLDIISGNFIFKMFFVVLGVILMFMTFQITWVLSASFGIFSLLGLIFL